MATLVYMPETYILLIFLNNSSLHVYCKLSYLLRLVTHCREMELDYN